MDRSGEQEFKILFVMDSLFTGGAEYSTLRLAEFLKHLPGWQVRLVCLKKMNPSYNAADFSLQNEIIVLKSRTYLGRLFELARIARKFGPRWVHSILLSSNLLCRGLKLIYQRPFYIESLVNRTYDQSRFSDKNVNARALSIYRQIDKFTQRWSPDAFHAVTADIAAHFHEVTGTRADRVHVIPRGRKVNPFRNNAEVRKDIRNSLGIPEGALVFINVGRHEFQKDHATLIQAFQTVSQQYGQPCFLLIVGREGRETKTLKSMVIDKKLSDRVMLLGHREDVYQLMAASDAFVLSSVYEGIGGVLIEAEASALPIVCSDLEGLKEVVAVDKNAFTFQPGDHVTLTSLMMRLAEDALLRKTMSEESKKQFAEKFDIASIHQRMRQLYLDILQKAS